jgi:predicted DNA-binding transcriptional regulator AlpA
MEGGGKMKEMSARECAKLFGINLSSWYRWVQFDPTAPKRVHEAKRFARWNEEDVLVYQARLIAEGRTGHIPRKKEVA